MTKKEAPLVSVIVATKNEEKALPRLLRSVKSQTYPRLELIVVDNYSKDATREIAVGFGAQVFLHGPERSAQRNFGATVSKGEFLLFLDADMSLSPRVVEEGVAVASRVGDLSGIIIPEKSRGEKYWERVKAFEKSFYAEGAAEVEAARFFSRDAFRALGGFDPKLVAFEDWDLTMRVEERGFRLERTRSVVYHHESIPTLWHLLAKKYYYASRSARYFMRKHQLTFLSSKVNYFLRPIFCRYWRKLLAHPLLAAGMFTLFFLELGAGGLGLLKSIFSKPPAD
jgi:glycosyltransferase involved in cell wall biosynthesis